MRHDHAFATINPSNEIKAKFLPLYYTQAIHVVSNKQHFPMAKTLLKAEITLGDRRLVTPITKYISTPKPVTKTPLYAAVYYLLHPSEIRFPLFIRECFRQQVIHVSSGNRLNVDLASGPSEKEKKDQMKKENKKPPLTVAVSSSMER